MVLGAVARVNGSGARERESYSEGSYGALLSGVRGGDLGMYLVHRSPTVVREWVGTTHPPGLAVCGLVILRDVSCF